MNTETPKILREFLIYLTTITGKSQKTRKEYEYDLMMMLRFLWCMQEGKEATELKNISVKHLQIEFIRDISLEDLYMFLEYCEVTRDNSAHTRARKVASIKSFFKYIQGKRRLIDYNPAEELETPKVGKRTPIYMELDETYLFLDGVKGDRHYYRNTCILVMLLNLAIRVSELCSLNLSSIQGDSIRVTGKGNKERIIPLNDYCTNSIGDYMKYERINVRNIQDKEALFLSQKGTRMNKRTVQRLVKTVNELSGLNKSNLTPHKLRHTAATLLYREKQDIRSLQYILGHESVSTTQIYTHVEASQISELMSSNPLNRDRKTN